MQKIVLATSNSGKVKELSRVLAEFGCNIMAQSELGVIAPEETGLTFVENALLKARHAASMTGSPALADDSGLVVPALAGAPGIYSARYAGVNATDAQNIAQLLTALEAVDGGERQASFHCVLVYLRHPADPTPIICQGSWSGEILHEGIGQSGFGYDPIFWLPELAKSAAELTAEEKMAISHRGIALQQLLSKWRNE